jgi:V/A-type H+/Na+-transporting ATPase subunit K
MKKFKVINGFLIFSAAVLAVIATVFAHAAIAQTPSAPAAVQSLPPLSTALGFFSAALSVGLSCLGAGIAVKSVGSAAMGAIAEKPELTGRALIFVGLAEGIAIYGLIVAIMILGKLV